MLNICYSSIGEQSDMADQSTYPHIRDYSEGWGCDRVSPITHTASTVPTSSFSSLDDRINFLFLGGRMFIHCLLVKAITLASIRPGISKC